VFDGGKRIEHLVQINDIFPGLLDLLEIDAPEARESIQGVSLMGALDGPVREFALVEAQTPKHVLRRILSQHADFDSRWAFRAHKAARTLEYKYIWTSAGDDMLFDIRRDPDERWDLLRGRNGPLEDGRYPEDVARELKQKIEDLLMSVELRTFPDMFRPGRAHMDPKVIRRLAAWGLYQPGLAPPWEGG
jgi:arylsulfatase A-like enzyme